jgi:hypothetical protein
MTIEVTGQRFVGREPLDVDAAVAELRERSAVRSPLPHWMARQATWSLPVSGARGR